MDQEQVDIYDAAPAGHFLKNVGNNWLEGAGGDASSEPYGVIFGQEPTPLVSSILHEVRYGWTMPTILDFWGPLFPAVLFFALLVGTSIVYCTVRILQIRRVERAAFRAAANPIVSKDTSRVQLRWHGILEQVASDDPQKWRTAILEADHLLNELLDTLGYKGETMADKMRKADVTTFNSIDFAWGAHQIRDRITHDASFILDAHEAKRIVKLYERVFKEFKVI